MFLCGGDLPVPLPVQVVGSAREYGWLLSTLVQSSAAFLAIGAGLSGTVAATRLSSLATTRAEWAVKQSDVEAKAASKALTEAQLQAAEAAWWYGPALPWLMCSILAGPGIEIEGHKTRAAPFDAQSTGTPFGAITPDLLQLIDDQASQMKDYFPDAATRVEPVEAPPLVPEAYKRRFEDVFVRASRVAANHGSGAIERFPVADTVDERDAAKLVVAKASEELSRAEQEAAISNAAIRAMEGRGGILPHPVSIVGLGLAGVVGPLGLLAAPSDVTSAAIAIGLTAVAVASGSWVVGSVLRSARRILRGAD